MTEIDKSTRLAAPYVNAGNDVVLSLVPAGVRRILDVGCGGGDNARHLRATHPGVEIVGLTHSEEEVEIARPYLDAIHVVDLDRGLSDAALEAWGAPFDLLLFSHVLENLIDPLATLRRCLTRLQPGGYAVIAVPNVLEWRTRMKFLRGHFVYTEHGILDRAHMRFFTYETASTELVAPIEGLALLDQRPRGALPLGPLRRIGAGRPLWSALDRAGLRRRPNLFSRETAILARWGGGS
ncbi:methyltransferase family protein [Roseinatronobacter thiooxidans]|uniref:Methyltransferase family protein n=1 Tax=Roseinatronobacter thiooxidans TaxID=121821 RepID=A0A2W7QVY6_9RHOB|nr:class I SAM-dependent methyltransferase [Roseinatronobacter thiooxidans]PZX45759.1 methyltransferase family protein [Roseinatronobacter thiooxidans]